MRASEVLAEEQKYHSGWVQTNTAKAAKYGAVDVFDYKPKNSSDYFYEEKHAKNLLVLHFTAGWLWGDLSTLTTAHLHVSVAFVVGRSGKIYRLFNPEYWSNHLGRERDVVGGNRGNSKRSVAIEISNVGPLTPNGDKLRFAGSTYCDLSEAQYYTKLGTPFRGYKYFASFTDGQYTSLKALIGEIAKQSGIKKSLRDPAERYLPFKTGDAAQKYKGIASHVNFRKSGKWDIGPAFDWSKI